MGNKLKTTILLATLSGLLLLAGLTALLVVRRKRAAHDVSERSEG